MQDAMQHCIMDIWMDPYPCGMIVLPLFHNISENEAFTIAREAAMINAIGMLR